MLQLWGSLTLPLEAGRTHQRVVGFSVLIILTNLWKLYAATRRSLSSPLEGRQLAATVSSTSLTTVCLISIAVSNQPSPLVCGGTPLAGSQSVSLFFIGHYLTFIRSSLIVYLHYITSMSNCQVFIKVYSCFLPTADDYYVLCFSPVTPYYITLFPFVKWRAVIK